jgi:hypothetical protein
VTGMWLKALHGPCKHHGLVTCIAVIGFHSCIAGWRLAWLPSLGIHTSKSGPCSQLKQALYLLTP